MTMIFGRGTRMTFGPSKRHEATRYIAERGSGGWKKHGNRISSSTPASRHEGMRTGSFLPASSSLRSSLEFVRFAILTASLIKLLREERSLFLPFFASSSSLFLSVIRTTLATWRRGNCGVAFGKTNLILS